MYRLERGGGGGAPFAVLYLVHDKPQKIDNEQLQKHAGPRHAAVLLIIRLRQQIKVPHNCKIRNQHDVSLGIRQVLLQLRKPVELGEGSGEVDGLGEAAASPYCVPHEDSEVGEGDPLVSEEEAGVVVDEEGGGGGGGGGGVGHGRGGGGGGGMPEGRGLQKVNSDLERFES